ncbi:MAG TPA: hypothetical protein VNT26_11270, partial [Candidatus Sulfotelmatobacter sp.]|nr:hypothetical protein [Candidatus Sulfotelmatobacter sp.]
SDPRWLVTLERFLSYLQANGISATDWAAGPWWGKDPLTIQPEGLGAGKTPADRPQMKVLRQFPG